MRLCVFLVALAVSSTTRALRIASLTHSGPGCPQDSKITWTGHADDFLITLNDFSASLSPGQLTSCQVHVLVDQGDPGRTLLLQDVIVRGGLYLGPNTKVDFYTSAYWSEAASETVTKHATSSSGSSGLAKNVAVSQRLNSASTCVGSNGYVGILNVNFRIVSQGGSRVVFGKERDSSPVTESLGLTSLSC